jgi:PASTA domain
MPRLRSRVAAAAAGVALAGLTVATTLTFAAGNPPRAAAPKHKLAARSTLVVPDVVGKAYIFAEGMLDDAGFAWRVEGPVAGFAANTVVEQTPDPGARVLDTGAPTIALLLEANPQYAETGSAVDAAPFAGTAIRFLVTPRRARPRKTAATTQRAARAHRQGPTKAAAEHATGRRRPPAFTKPGAPKEPLDEMPLTDRALLLRTWLRTHRTPTAPNVRHWLYQHAWIVDGGRFGWWHGAQALQTLIQVDRAVQRLWHVGSRSEAVAREALAEVRTRTR